MDGVDDGLLEVDGEPLEEIVIVDVIDGEFVADALDEILDVTETVPLLVDVLHGELDGEADPLFVPL